MGKDLTVDWEELGRSQKDDQVLQDLWDKAKYSPQEPDHIHYNVQNQFLFQCIPDCLQVVIPTNLRQKFLEFAHDNLLSGHLGCMKTLHKLLDVVYWPEIRRDAWNHCKQCQVCQKYKPRIHKFSRQLQSTPIKEPGYMLGLDLMHPFPKSSKLNEYLLVVVDYCSKWVEVFPLRSVKTHVIADILVKEIFTRWGTPTYLVSDRGPQFTSQPITHYVQAVGSGSKTYTAHHPQTNLTERVNRTLKNMIASYVKDNHRHWDR